MKSPRRTKPLRYKSLRQLISVTVDSALEQWPVLKPGVNWIRKEALGIKKGWVLFSLLAVLFAVAGGWLVHHVDRGTIIDLANTVTNQDITIRNLRQQVELTPDEQKEWDRASDAFKRGCFYRDQKTNWIECARSFEEAYVNALPVALKHPEDCEWTGHLAQDLVGPYEKLNRPVDAALAADAKLVLHNLPGSRFDPSSASPSIDRAIELYNNLKKQPAH